MCLEHSILPCGAGVEVGVHGGAAQVLRYLHMALHCWTQLSYLGFGSTTLIASRVPKLDGCGGDRLILC